jgi:hypothetical protein
MYGQAVRMGARATTTARQRNGPAMSLRCCWIQPIVDGWQALS